MGIYACQNASLAVEVIAQNSRFGRETGFVYMNETILCITCSSFCLLVVVVACFLLTQNSVCVCVPFNKWLSLAGF